MDLTYLSSARSMSPSALCSTQSRFKHSANPNRSDTSSPAVNERSETKVASSPSKPRTAAITTSSAMNVSPCTCSCSLRVKATSTMGSNQPGDVSHPSRFVTVAALPPGEGGGARSPRMWSFSLSLSRGVRVTDEMSISRELESLDDDEDDFDLDNA